MEAVQKIEQVKHLPIKFGEVARYVIVPGDPNRVPVIAESLENVINQGQNRALIQASTERGSLTVFQNSCPQQAFRAC